VNWRQQLIIFTRYPELGKVKTRMIPGLGEKGSQELHQKLAEYTLHKLKGLRNFLSLVIYYYGGNEEKMRAWLGEYYYYRSQRGKDLGAKMQNAFADGFAQGMAAIAIIGTDCPEMGEKLILEAFEALKTHDLVLGPAVDGGYYLIGLKQVFPELFDDIPWGTGEVFAKTRTIAAKLALKTAYLPKLADIDRPEDLPILHDYFPDLRLNDDGGSHLD
jgi:rSAM/selenodomain-associated transferase 1